MSYINSTSVNSTVYDIYGKALNDGTNEVTAAQAKTMYDTLGTGTLPASSTVTGLLDTDGKGYVPTKSGQTLSATQSLEAEKNMSLIKQGATSGAPAPASTLGFETVATFTP